MSHENTDRQPVIRRRMDVAADSRYRGREARRRAQAWWSSEWGVFRFEPDEFLLLGDDRILLVGRMTGSGSQSGANTSHPWADLFTVSAGLAVREQAFLDRGDALRAAGLAE